MHASVFKHKGAISHTKCVACWGISRENCLTVIVQCVAVCLLFGSKQKTFCATRLTQHTHSCATQDDKYSHSFCGIHMCHIYSQSYLSFICVTYIHNHVSFMCLTCVGIRMCYSYVSDVFAFICVIHMCHSYVSHVFAFICVIHMCHMSIGIHMCRMHSHPHLSHVFAFICVIHMCHSYVSFICVIHMCHMYSHSFIHVIHTCHSYMSFICVACIRIHMCHTSIHIHMCHITSRVRAEQFLSNKCCSTDMNSHSCEACHTYDSLCASCRTEQLLQPMQVFVTMAETARSSTWLGV